MSQISRPGDDVSNSGWTPATNYFRQINEELQNDATFVESSPDPQGDTFEVRLRSLAWPRSGPQTLRVRLRAYPENPIFPYMMNAKLMCSIAM